VALGVCSVPSPALETSISKVIECHPGLWIVNPSMSEVSHTFGASHHGVDHGGNVTHWRGVVLTEDESFCATGARTLWLHYGNHREKEAHLSIE
jgi:hypothetical protein